MTGNLIGGGGNPLFGPGWQSTPRAADALFVATPIGQECLYCEDPVREGDTGEIMPMVRLDGTAYYPVHRECLALHVIGHTLGVCGCTDYAGEGSKRAAALECWRRLNAEAER